MIDARSNDFNIGLRYNKPRKVITCMVTLVAFFINIFSYDLSWAAGAPSELTSVGSDKTGSPVVKELNAKTFAIPEYLGHIKETSFGKNGRTVIQIQDAHCNYEAQKKVAEIVEYLNLQYGIRAVNLEGGSKDYDLSVFTRITDRDARKRTSEYFVKEGRINGAEYFAINNPEKVSLWGIEDPVLYLDNLTVYRNSLSHKEEIEKSLKSLGHILTNLKIKIYSKDLLEFDSRYSAYKANNIELKEYLGYLLDEAKSRSVDMNEYHNIDLLSRVLREESGIDFKKADNERDSLVDILQKKLSKSSMEEFIVRTVEFKTEKISQKAFYEYLLKKADKFKLDPKDYPELVKYATYITLYDAVDKMKIMDEIESLEAKIKDSLFENDTQRELARLSKDLVIMKNIFNISLTREDYRYYKAHENEFATRNFTRFIEREAPMVLDPSLRASEASESISSSGLDRYRDEIARFYEYSFKRDKAFIRNMRLSKGSNVAIMVTGGFHTDNLCDILKKEGTSYISIIPNFTNDKGYKSPYFDLLSGQPTSIEKAILPHISAMQVPSCLSPVKGAITDDLLLAFAIDVHIRSMIEQGEKFKITDDKGAVIPGLDFSQGDDRARSITVSELLKLVEVHTEEASAYGKTIIGNTAKIKELQDERDKVLGILDDLMKTGDLKDRRIAQKLADLSVRAQLLREAIEDATLVQPAQTAPTPLVSTPSVPGAAVTEEAIPKISNRELEARKVIAEVHPKFTDGKEMTSVEFGRHLEAKINKEGEGVKYRHISDGFLGIAARNMKSILRAWEDRDMLRVLEYTIFLIGFIHIPITFVDGTYYRETRVARRASFIAPLIISIASLSAIFFFDQFIMPIIIAAYFADLVANQFIFGIDRDGSIKHEMKHVYIDLILVALKERGLIDEIYKASALLGPDEGLKEVDRETLTESDLREIEENIINKVIKPKDEYTRIPVPVKAAAPAGEAALTLNDDLGSEKINTFIATARAKGKRFLLIFDLDKTLSADNSKPISDKMAKYLIDAMKAGDVDVAVLTMRDQEQIDKRVLAPLRGLGISEDMLTGSDSERRFFSVQKSGMDYFPEAQFSASQIYDYKETIREILKEYNIKNIEELKKGDPEPTNKNFFREGNGIVTCVLKGAELLVDGKDIRNEIIGKLRDRGINAYRGGNTSIDFFPVNKGDAAIAVIADVANKRNVKMDKIAVIGVDDDYKKNGVGRALLEAIVNAEGLALTGSDSEGMKADDMIPGSHFVLDRGPRICRAVLAACAVRVGAYTASLAEKNNALKNITTPAGSLMPEGQVVASYLKGLGINPEEIISKLKKEERPQESAYFESVLDVNNSNRSSLYQVFSIAAHDDASFSLLFYQDKPIAIVLDASKIPDKEGYPLGCVILADPDDDMIVYESRIAGYFGDRPKVFLKLESEPKAADLLKQITGRDGPPLIGFPGVFRTDIDKLGKTSRAIVESMYSVGRAREINPRQTLPLIRKGDKVLVFGCGRGIDVIAAGLSQAGSVDAIDINDNAIQNTKLNLQRWNLNNVNVMKNDGFNGLGRYDVIIFNAPLIEPGGKRDSENLASYDINGNVNMKFLNQLKDHLTDTTGLAVYSNEYSGDSEGVLDKAFAENGLFVDKIWWENFDKKVRFGHETIEIPTQHAVFKIKVREPSKEDVAPAVAVPANVYDRKFLEDKIVVLRNNVPGKPKGEQTLKVWKLSNMKTKDELERVAGVLENWLLSADVVHGRAIASMITHLREKPRKALLLRSDLKSKTRSVAEPEYPFYDVYFAVNTHNEGGMEVPDEIEGMVEVIMENGVSKFVMWEINPANRNKGRESELKESMPPAGLAGRAVTERKYEGVGGQLLRHAVNRELKESDDIQFILPGAFKELKNELIDARNLSAKTPAEVKNMLRESILAKSVKLLEYLREEAKKGDQGAIDILKELGETPPGQTAMEPAPASGIKSFPAAASPVTLRSASDTLAMYLNDSEMGQKGEGDRWDINGKPDPNGEFVRLEHMKNVAASIDAIADNKWDSFPNPYSKQTTIGMDRFEMINRLYESLPANYKEALINAAALHDNMKLIDSTKDHYKAGAEWAGTELSRRGYSDSEIALVKLLIEHHSDPWNFANSGKRDFEAVANDKNLLTALIILGIADIHSSGDRKLTDEVLAKILSIISSQEMKEAIVELITANKFDVTEFPGDGGAPVLAINPDTIGSANIISLDELEKKIKELINKIGRFSVEVDTVKLLDKSGNHPLAVTTGTNTVKLNTSDFNPAGNNKCTVIGVMYMGAPVLSIQMPSRVVDQTIAGKEETVPVTPLVSGRGIDTPESRAEALTPVAKVIASRDSIVKVVVGIPVGSKYNKTNNVVNDINEALAKKGFSILNASSESLSQRGDESQIITFAYDPKPGNPDTVNANYTNYMEAMKKATDAVSGGKGHVVSFAPSMLDNSTGKWDLLDDQYHNGPDVTIVPDAYNDCDTNPENGNWPDIMHRVGLARCIVMYNMGIDKEMIWETMKTQLQRISTNDLENVNNLEELLAQLRLVALQIKPVNYNKDLADWERNQRAMETSL